MQAAIKLLYPSHVLEIVNDRFLAFWLYFHNGVPFSLFVLRFHLGRVQRGLIQSHWIYEYATCIIIIDGYKHIKREM